MKVIFQILIFPKKTNRKKPAAIVRQPVEIMSSHIFRR
ncbi:hypothetical protein CHCC20331_2366 [Bacillus paralicheniformis]|uniref:Uncharacterized protein n=1 Tax=Bacillus paralicheniformis TaxID=1648923 RepID=A0A7Z0WWJ5_9BACI|nr:hypothetical protein B4121_3746 [Bacillus paralicheniformis]TWJ65356.1 hypothetical protein CHCC5022_4045 [Bacillus paralicheniformis]TWJ77827.1 hypothetical protein CHCC4186_1961 [Bacillus paralicheniformis]TWK87005.1 hypothetical protein CHCC20331_2366 [Bacillus paralicheniformis]